MTQTHKHTVTQGASRFPYNYSKGVKQTWQIRWTYKQELMHVHILIKMWDHKQGDWDTHTVPHMGSPVSMELSIGGLANMGSQVDINTCTDACTHSKQGVWTEIKWLGHKHTAIQGHPGFHQTMHRGCSRQRQSGGHKFMYWCKYTF